MRPNHARERFLEDHADLPPGHVVALIGSHRRVAWPRLCPACGAPASTDLTVTKIFGRRVRYGGYASYRYILGMRIPFCRMCAERHRQLVTPVPSVIASFFRTPALLSSIGAVAVAAILGNIFLRDGGGVSQGARMYAAFSIIALVGTGLIITAREARFLRVPPLTEITRACDFSDNLGYPFGRRRLYAIRNPVFADAFTRANQDRLWTDAIQTRDKWVSGIAFVVLIAAAVIVWLLRG